MRVRASRQSATRRTNLAGSARAALPASGPVAGSARLAGMVGPAALVSVGYMDPGNWATDLEGGARFGYQLLWVLLASNLLALLLQTLSARLGVVTGLDLASGCREQYPRALSSVLWVLAEVAIIACDLAEILGGAVALHLLFRLPLLLGAVLTSVDALFILMLQRRGSRWLEAVVIGLCSLIALCMFLEVWLARPDAGAVARGLVPRLHGDSLYLAIGILGATVMPHNLYLQSGIVPHARTAGERRSLLRRSFWSTGIALNAALLVNAAILVLAAAVFFTRGLAVTDLRDAHRLLSPLLGTGFASLLLALGLLFAGQNATVSGTLAGQVVMEGFMGIRMSPLLRRVLTRGLAIVPALVVLSLAGDGGVSPLLIASQVLLSLQLPFAVVPLLKLTSEPRLMGAHASGPLLRVLGYVAAIVIVGANAALIEHTVAELRGSAPLWATLLACLGAGMLGLLLVLCCTPLAASPRRSSGAPLQPSAATTGELAK